MRWKIGSKKPSVISAGQVSNPSRVGALAATGITGVEVVAKPSVAILSTGDELVEPEIRPALQQIRNSNAPMLAARLREMAIDARYPGIAGDDEAALNAKLASGFEHDLLLVSGGVSVGDYDLVGRRLAAAGMETLFHGVAMKPGKPAIASRRGRCLVVGLPGNPLSAFTGFEVLVAPALHPAQHQHPEGMEVMREKSIRHLPVVEKEDFVGLVTEGDLRQASLLSLVDKEFIEDVMVKNPITISPEASIEEAARLIHRHKIGGLPVVKGKKLVGILTIVDILQSFIQLLGILKSSSRIDVVLGGNPHAFEEISGVFRANRAEIISVGMSNQKDRKKRVYYFRLGKCRHS